MWTMKIGVHKLKYFHNSKYILNLFTCLSQRQAYPRHHHSHLLFIELEYKVTFNSERSWPFEFEVSNLWFIWRKPRVKNKVSMKMVIGVGPFWRFCVQKLESLSFTTYGLNWKFYFVLILEYLIKIMIASYKNCSGSESLLFYKSSGSLRYVSLSCPTENVFNNRCTKMLDVFIILSVSNHVILKYVNDLGKMLWHTDFNFIGLPMIV